MSDYYQLLGIPRNASSEEIKKAFRDKALENHPDRISHLPDDERLQRQESMYQINDAWDTLSNPEKRNLYDRQTVEQQRSTRSTEGTRTSSPGREQSYNDIFSSVFGSMFDSRIYDIFGTQATDKGDYFMIPESDWGLLAAFKMAYESKTDGKWRVKKAEDDKRSWMPDEVYSVQRDGEKVLVFRRITDWRDEWNRNKKIKATKEGGWETEEVAADTFLGEYYLCGKGRVNLTESYNIPFGFDRYIQALKSLASKFARKEKDGEDKYTVTEELREMNRYGNSGSKNTRIEGQSWWASDEDREWVRKVDFDNFWKRMEKAEGRVVQVEGFPRTKEDQYKSSGENVG